MKHRKITPDPKVASPARPAAEKPKAETAKPGDAEYVKPPVPHQATTEEAVEAWRNEGDPN